MSTDTEKCVEDTVLANSLEMSNDTEKCAEDTDLTDSLKMSNATEKSAEDTVLADFLNMFNDAEKSTVDNILADFLKMSNDTEKCAEDTVLADSLKWSYDTEKYTEDTVSTDSLNMSIYTEHCAEESVSADSLKLTIDTEKYAEDIVSADYLNMSIDTEQCAEDSVSADSLKLTIDTEKYVEDTVSADYLNMSIDTEQYADDSVSADSLKLTIDTEKYAEDSVSADYLNMSIDTEQYAEDSVSADSLKLTIDTEKYAEDSVSEDSLKLTIDTEQYAEDSVSEDSLKLIIDTEKYAEDSVSADSLKLSIDTEKCAEDTVLVDSPKMSIDTEKCAADTVLADSLKMSNGTEKYAEDTEQYVQDEQELASTYRLLGKHKLPPMAPTAPRNMMRGRSAALEEPSAKFGRAYFDAPWQTTESTLVTPRPSAETNAIPTQQQDNSLLSELNAMSRMDIMSFDESMMLTKYGPFVLMIRPWTSLISNINTSCHVCNVPFRYEYKHGRMRLFMNKILVAEGRGSNKARAKSNLESLAWDELRHSVIVLYVKEMLVAYGATITLDQLLRLRDRDFGRPFGISNRRMNMMGWTRGGHGAGRRRNQTGPIRPNVQLVIPSCSGKQEYSMDALRGLITTILHRYIAADTMDMDLAFSQEFSVEERSVMYHIAHKLGLSTKSSKFRKDRTLVIRRKLDPFGLTRAVVAKGGSSPKYEVFIPCGVKFTIYYNRC